MLVRSETLPRVFSCGLRAQSRARGIGGRGREEGKAERGAVGGARPLAPRGGATVAKKLPFPKCCRTLFALVDLLIQVEPESTVGTLASLVIRDVGGGV